MVLPPIEIARNLVRLEAQSTNPDDMIDIKLEITRHERQGRHPG